VACRPRNGLTLFTLVLTVAAGGSVVTAHHSFAAHYFEEQTVSLEGDLVEFEYTNPHAWVHLVARDESGAPRKYSAEWGNITRLSQRGVTKETLRPGDRLIVTGSPGRNPADRKIHLKQIVRPSDGWQWAAGRR
jgi:hypothetical protein